MDYGEKRQELGHEAIIAHRHRKQKATCGAHDHAPHVETFHLRGASFVTLKLPAERASADRANICWISSITFECMKSRCRLDGQDSSLPCAWLCLSGDQSNVVQAPMRFFCVGCQLEEIEGENAKKKKKKTKRVCGRYNGLKFSVFLDIVRNE